MGIKASVEERITCFTKDSLSPKMPYKQLLNLYYLPCKLLHMDIDRTKKSHLLTEVCMNLMRNKCLIDLELAVGYFILDLLIDSAE